MSRAKRKRGSQAKELLKAYFMEILELLEWGNFDVLAHLTYPLRYFYAKSGIRISLEDYKKELDEILKLCAEKEKALELNSAGLRQPIGEFSPPASLLKRFKELGGKFVTYGSDAHRVQDLAANIEEAYATIEAAGFDRITFFQQRIPMQIALK